MIIITEGREIAPLVLRGRYFTKHSERRGAEICCVLGEFGVRPAASVAQGADDLIGRDGLVVNDD